MGETHIKVMRLGKSVLNYFLLFIRLTSVRQINTCIMWSIWILRKFAIL